MLKVKAEQILEGLALKIQKLVPPSRLVVGLSGGADSTLVLLSAVHLARMDRNYSVLAVHCIHGLDLDDPVWLAHNQKLCAELDVPLVTPKLHIVYGQGESPEAVSRAERYRALVENLDEHSVLLLGHQADDQVENFFLALKRGAGPHGLSGMTELIHDERGRILRPLLELRKSTIIEVIEALGYTYVFDISNTYLKFERNFVRLKVLPLLTSRFHGLEKSVLRSTKLCAYEHDLAMRYTREVFKNQVDECNLILNLEGLDVNDLALMFALLRMFLSLRLKLPAPYNTVSEAYNLCLIGADQHVALKLTSEYTLRRFQKKLYLVKDGICQPQGCYTLNYGTPLKIDDYTFELVKTELDNGFSCARVILDFDYTGKMRLHPKGRHHSREIKKLFVEYEIPSWLRNTKCVVRDEHGEILAFADVFLQHADSLPSKSKEFYRLRITRH